MYNKRICSISICKRNKGREKETTRKTPLKENEGEGGGLRKVSHCMNCAKGYRIAQNCRRISIDTVVDELRRIQYPPHRVRG